MDVRYDEPEFSELLVHVGDRLRADRAGGATKLNKVLFFVEFTHLRRHHAVVSGCEFQKLPTVRRLVSFSPYDVGSSSSATLN